MDDSEPIDDLESEPIDDVEADEGGEDDGGGGGDVTDVEEEGWGSRLQDSCRSMCLGPVLILIAIVLLFWNEGRTVHRLKDLDQALNGVVELGDIATVDNSTDGTFIHASGPAQAKAPLSDDEFGVRQSALKLRRTVETYQWVEKKESRKQKKRGGGTRTVTEYTYDRQWRTGLTNSSSFRNEKGHRNPNQVLFEPLNLEADPITFGSFQLPNEIVTRLNYFSTVTNISVDGLSNTTTNTTKQRVTVTGETPPYFLFGNLTSPRVGDTRVSFSVVPSNLTISIMAEQTGNTFRSFTTPRGGQVLLVEQGVVSAQDMVENAKSENRVIAWVLRLVGAVLLFVGGKVLLDPLVVFADVLPILGDIVEVGTSIVAGIVAVILWVTVVAIAWLFYRPLIGGLVLLVIGVGVGTTLWCARQRRLQRLEPEDKL